MSSPVKGLLYNLSILFLNGKWLATFPCHGVIGGVHKLLGLISVRPIGGEDVFLQSQALGWQPEKASENHTDTSSRKKIS